MNRLASPAQCHSWVAPIGEGFWRLKKKEERRRGMTCAKVSYEEVA
jgi:hypothetical protein